MIEVEFRYETGLAASPFLTATLLGSWTADGRPFDGPWSRTAMGTIRSEDGTPGFVTTVAFDPDAIGRTFRWGVELTRGDSVPTWGIFAEHPGDAAQHRSFVLRAPSERRQRENYRLSWHRCRGAQRWWTGEGGPAGIRFSVWAPNAIAVSVVFGGPSGHIAEDGYGQHAEHAPLPMSRSDADPQVWELVEADFESFVGRLYLFMVERDDGSLNWATDMFSRERCGEGDHDPGAEHYDGTPAALNARVSCSRVVDPSLVAPYPRVPGASPQPESDFWAD